MVKEARILKSLDALNLSNRTKNYLEKHFATIDEIVREGRIDAFEQYLGVQLKDKTPKWKTELIAALRDASFIRPTVDFAMTFQINKLYCVVHKEWEGHFTSNIRQLSNEQYEKFQTLPEILIVIVKRTLRECLTGREYDVICYRFGLCGDGISRDLESAGKHFNVTRERIRQIEAKALRKLKHFKTKLPVIYKMPSNAKEDDSGIEKLDFSVRTYNCLKRARINTVDDVVNLPKKDWLRVRNFGRKNLKEVVEKMHSAGYEDFYIDIPE